MNATCEAATIPAEEKVSLRERLGNIAATAYVVMHFVPILTSVCWILYFCFGQNDTLLKYLAPVMLLGIVCTLVTHPIAIPWACLKRIGYAFWRPFVGIPLIPMNIAAAAVCGGLMMTLCLGAILFAPGALSLYYFFAKD